MESHVTISDTGWIQATQNMLERKVSIWKSEREVPTESSLLFISKAEGFISLLAFRSMSKDSISVTFTIRDAMTLKALLES